MKIFISAVSSEFRQLRADVARSLRKIGYEVRDQDYFRNMPGTLLELIADYIAECDEVIVIAGWRSGFMAEGPGVPPSAPPRSYTQWEYFLAEGERLDGSKAKPKRIRCYLAERDYAAEEPDGDASDGAALQQAHRQTLLASNRLCNEYKTSHDVQVAILEDFHVAGDGHVTKPNNLPYDSIGSLFKGREELLALLLEKIEGNRQPGLTRIPPIALHGLGGVGKTRVAVEFASAHRDAFTALIFIGADSPTMLDQNLAKLCGAAVLDLPEKEATESEVQVQAALRWLETNPGWFLIFDNVDTEDAADAVEALLARLAPHGQVLITSRLSNWAENIEDLNLDVLRTEDAVDYLVVSTANKRRPLETDPTDAAELATVLGQLPLALTQASAYIRELGLSFRGYLQKWNEAHDKVIRWFDERQMKYPKSVAVTWETSFEQLNDDTRELLRILAWFAPDPIPTSILKVPVPQVDSRIEISADTLEEAEAQLKRYSLVSRDVGSSTFSVHRLVQDVTRAAMSDANRGNSLNQAVSWLDSAFVGDPQDVRSWPIIAPLFTHSVGVVEMTDEGDCSYSVAHLMDRCGQLCLFRAQYSMAESLIARALHTAEVCTDSEYPRLAEHFNNLGFVYHYTNQPAQAEPLYRRAIAISEASLGPDHPTVAIRLNNVAALLQATNRLAEAEPLYRRALAIRESSFGPDHPDVAQSLNNLAGLLKATNRLAEAETLYKRVVDIFETSLGREHPNVATALNNLALLLKATNRLAEAEPLYRRAIAIDEASYGPEHPEVATALNNLAGLLKATNRLAEAEPLYRRALAIWQSSLGEDHPNVASALNNLAGLLQATNRLAEAEPLFRRALAIHETSYGTEHPNVATALINLAGLLESTKRLAEAEPLYRRAIAIDEASYGPDHPEVATDINNLAQLLRATNRLAEAEPLYRRAIAIDEASYGPDHPDVARDLNNLALLLKATNRLAEAEPMYRRALAIDEASYGPDHPTVARDLNNLALLLEATNRLEEAEPMYRRALTIFGASYGPDHPSTVTVRENLESLGTN